MCCYATKKATDALRNKMKKHGGKMTFWKIVRKNATSLVYVHRWNVGTHIGSYCKPKIYSDRDTEISEGIHVYLNKKDVLCELRGYRQVCYDHMLLNVTCDVDDLLGAEDSFWAVFSKVEVTPKQWTKMKKCKSDYLLKERA